MRRRQFLVIGTFFRHLAGKADRRLLFLRAVFGDLDIDAGKQSVDEFFLYFESKQAEPSPEAEGDLFSGFGF